MTFLLHVDAPAWRAHLRAFRDDIAAAGATLVPVIKGNGYGFGLENLVREVVTLNLDVIAVGNVWEAREVLSHHEHGFVGDVVVLNPWDPRDHTAMTVWNEIEQWENSHRLIRTVSSPEALNEVGHRRHVVEQVTNMARFGLHHPTAPGASEGVSVHLPLEHQQLPAVGAQWSSLWVSHLAPKQLSVLAVDNKRVFLRAGTALWLNRATFTAKGTVLEVHRNVTAPVGYRQRRIPQGATLVVVGGGTAHGVGLSAPTAAANLRSRVVSAGSGILNAVGRALSPFYVNGKQVWFAEPPHMHVSMIWLDAKATAPQIGDQLTCDVRMTTAHFDQIIGL